MTALRVKHVSVHAADLDDSAQKYLRDPSGNLVECNALDADSLDRAIVGELVPVGGEIGARLFL